MTYDNSKEGRAREYLAIALRALEGGHAASASREIVRALQWCFSIVREGADSDPPRYRMEWESVAKELSKLPPSLLRQAVRLLDDRPGHQA